MNYFCDCMGLGDIARKHEQGHFSRRRTLCTAQLRASRGPFEVASNDVRGPFDYATTAALRYRERMRIRSRIVLAKPPNPCRCCVSERIDRLIVITRGDN